MGRIIIGTLFVVTGVSTTSIGLERLRSDNPEIDPKAEKILKIANGIDIVSGIALAGLGVGMVVAGFSK